MAWLKNKYIVIKSPFEKDKEIRIEFIEYWKGRVDGSSSENKAFYSCAGGNFVGVQEEDSRDLSLL